MTCCHFALLLTLGIACNGCSRTPTAYDEIDRVYRDYCDAVARADGVHAGSLVSAGTLSRYQEFAHGALTADQTALDSLPVTARLQILLLRQRMDAATLSTFDGPQLFAAIIDRGWFESSGFRNTQLGMIAIDRDQAQAPVHRNGRPTRDRAYFLRENGAWKINLLPNLTGSDRVIETAAAQNRLSENAYLEALVAEVTRQPVRDNIWQPLQSTDAVKDDG